MAQHTIFVATRSGCIQVLRDGVLLPRRLGLESHAVAMAVAGPQLAVPCMASTLVMFNVVTLVRTASLALPSQPQAMAVIQHSSAALVAVALRDCSVMLFSGTTCVSRHTLSSRVAGLYAGATAVPVVGFSLSSTWFASYIGTSRYVCLSRRNSTSLGPACKLSGQLS